jgi:hypothetical protein
MPFDVLPKAVEGLANVFSVARVLFRGLLFVLGLKGCRGHSCS